ncbi:MAG: hypothetical protein HY586_01315 [Candidatus Omnitrophica bacterium]|nr:hypothetical protein [Candidatus Omnitrophota bacterium]
MIVISYSLAGHGHKMAALAIEEELRRRGTPFAVEVADTLLFTPKLFSQFYTGVYWWLVHTLPIVWLFFFWLLNLRPVHYLTQGFKQYFKSGVLDGYENFLRQKKPKQIVFTHFLGIHNAAQLKRRGEISSFIRVVVTDFYTHALWIHPGVDEYCVMFKETREDMIRRWGIEGKKIRVTGIPVLHKFLVSHKDKKQISLESLGLSQHRLTLLFTSGSFGYGPALRYLRSLIALKHHIQAVIVCGENKEKKARLEKEEFPFPVAVLGFVDNMDELMDSSDILVAKPGGITTSESLIKEVPMMIYSVIPGQEEGNLRLLEAYNACWRLLSPNDLYEIVKEILETPEELADKKKNVASLAKPHASRDIVDEIIITS